MSASRSLRAGLLFRVVLGVLVLLLLDAGLSLYTALQFGYQGYDRALQLSAENLLRQLTVQDGQVRLALPPAEQAAVGFDGIDRFYFRIDTGYGRLLAGDARLEPAAMPAVTIVNPRLDRQPMRTLARQRVLAGGTYTCTVAETVHRRSALTQQVLAAMLLPQLALLAGALALSWWSISRGLQPLTRMAELLRRRGPESLEPVEERHQPEEARILVIRLNELLAKVTETLASQRRFLADAAHQMRTPLAAIALHADRLALAPQSAEERSLLLEQLQLSVRRSARVSGQLLALARTEPGAIARSEFQRVELTKVARDIYREWIPVALDRGIDFGFDAPDTASWIYAHEGLLAEMLSNLIDNAFSYGRERGTVTVAVRPDGARAVDIAVEDDGIGVPRALRQRVFERFFRAENAAGTGCGLGLAIVSEIALLHAATVTLDESPLHGGARFSVCFRLAETLRTGG